MWSLVLKFAMRLTKAAREGEALALREAVTGWRGLNTVVVVCLVLLLF